jgi:hypothetical protein
MDSAYTDSIKDYVSLQSAGEIVTSQSCSGTGIMDMLLGSSSSSSSGSISDILLQALSQEGSSITTSASGGTAGYGGMLSSFASLLGGDSSFISSDSIGDISSLLGSRAAITSDDLKITRAGDHNVLKLSDEQWSEIRNIGLNVFVDDGEGYIDLGIDNVFDYDDNGNLITEYNGDWLALDGQVCAYYISEDDYDENTGYFYTRGYIPAELNGEQVRIIVEFTNNNPSGTILGAEKIYKVGENGVSTEGKGLIAIGAGDKVSLLCDYYKYDGTFNDSYTLGDPITVDDGGLQLQTLTMDNTDVYFSYRLTDYFQYNYWTQVQKIE